VPNIPLRTTKFVVVIRSLEDCDERSDLTARRFEFSV